MQTAVKDGVSEGKSLHSVFGCLFKTVHSVSIIFLRRSTPPHIKLVSKKQKKHIES